MNVMDKDRTKNLYLDYKLIKRKRFKKSYEDTPSSVDKTMKLLKLDKKDIELLS